MECPPFSRQHNPYVLIKFPSSGDYKYIHKTRAYKEHEVKTQYSTSNFRDLRFAYGVFGGKTCRVWFVL